MLLRVLKGDTLVSAELKGRLKKKDPVLGTRRTAGELQMRAREIADERDRAEAEHVAAEQRQQAKEAEKARRRRIEAHKRRGESVWRDVEVEIERRNSSGYDRAAELLSDLEVLAVEEGRREDFSNRLALIRGQHQKKRQFIERLANLGQA